MVTHDASLSGLTCMYCLAYWILYIVTLVAWPSFSKNGTAICVALGTSLAGLLIVRADPLARQSIESVHLQFFSGRDSVPALQVGDRIPNYRGPKHLAIWRVCPVCNVAEAQVRLNRFFTDYPDAQVWVSPQAKQQLPLVPGERIAVVPDESLRAMLRADVRMPLFVIFDGSRVSRTGVLHEYAK